MKSYCDHPPSNFCQIRQLGKFQKLLVIALFSIMNLPVIAQEDTRLEEVIVTAQKREQSIQDVSISVTAFSNAAIRELGIERTRDLARFTPGLVMNSSAGGEADPIFTLRGVGMNDTQSNQNPAVALYIDDIALAATPMLGFQIFDQERIEVLKGPQGTLYGRNTTGGAIKFISNKPTREFEAYADVTYGRFDRLEFEGAVGGALGDTLSGRLAVAIIEQNEGWQTLDLQGLGEFGPGVDENNGTLNKKGIRGSLLWEPSEKVDVLMVVDYAEDDSESLAFEHAGNLLADRSGLCSFGITGVRDETQCASFAQVTNTRGIDLLGPFDGAPTDAAVEVYQDTGSDPRTTGSNFALGNGIEGESWGFSGTINWQLERTNFTSVTGYRKMDRSLHQDQGASPFQIHDLRNDDDIESFSQEVRLSSDDSWGSFNWVVGAYYSEDDITKLTDTDFRDVVQGWNAKFLIGFTQKTETVAAFAQAEWDFSEQWRLIAGLRYTDINRDFLYTGTNLGGGPPPATGVARSINDAEASGKIGLEYTYSDDLLLYANFSRGFKGGGTSGSINFDPNRFQIYTPEILNAYEAGFKWTALDGTVRFNSAIYYYDWKDFQAATAVDIEGIRIIVLANAGDAEILGLESELNWSVTEQFTLHLGFNWMDAEIVSGDFDGDTPAHTPDFMLNGIAKYDFAPMSSGVTPFASVGFSYQDDIEFILTNHPGATQDAYTLVDARFGFTTEDGKWEFTASGANLTDKLYRTETFGPGSGFLPGRIFYGAPRTFGVSVRYSH
jgi:iron complex outermembrane receptor protein